MESRPTKRPIPSRCPLSDTVLPLSLGLGAMLVLVKILLLPFPVSTASEFARWLLRLAVVVAPDVCFLAALTTLCGAALLLTRRWRQVNKFAAVGTFGLYYLAGLYAIASLPMYELMKLPLTVPLVSYSGGPLLMASSIQELIPPWVMVLALAGPLLAILSPRLGARRFVPRVAPRRMPMACAAAMLLVAAYGAVCQAYVFHSWTDPNRWERRIAKSPHGVLLGSCLSECFKSRTLTWNTPFPDADESDFQPTTGDVPRATSPLAPAPARPKNIFLIVLESTGVEYLGCYGSKYPTTPNLDRLAARQGLVFDNVYVQTPNSCKSLVSLTASVVPRTDWRLIVRDCPDFNVPTMADTLVARGYRTCFLHSGYWRWKNRDQYLSHRGAQTIIDAERLPGTEVNSWGVSDRAMYQAALDWIDQNPGQPFFTFAYTIETHHPYVAPPNPHEFGVADEELARYLNAVRAADAHIAWLIQQLAARGLADSTLVAVTSDHGESFGQHDQRVHSFGVYEPDVHVPLVLLHPSLADGPRRSASLAQHIDIPATLVSAVGIAPPSEWQGRDLLSAPPRERVYVFSTGNEVVLGLREGTYKYHYYVDSGRQELFDLSSDPGELNNLAPQHSDLCHTYRRRVGGLVESQRRFLAAHGAP
jgi:arylsulfatase A-like enzyme